MTQLVRPMDRVRSRRQAEVETASIADDAQHTATLRATVLDAQGQPAPVRVDPQQRICLPLFKRS